MRDVEGIMRKECTPKRRHTEEAHLSTCREKTNEPEESCIVVR